jgi:hypothetical protein
VLARRSFDIDENAFRGLRLKLQAARGAITRVYLNGEQVAHVVRSRRSGYAKILLTDHLEQFHPDAGLMTEGQWFACHSFFVEDNAIWGR